MSVLQFVDQVPEEDMVKSPLTFILSDWLPAQPLKTTSLKSLLAPVPPENTIELLSKGKRGKGGKTKGKEKGKVACFSCGTSGHMKKDCWSISLRVKENLKVVNRKVVKGLVKMVVKQ